MARKQFTNKERLRLVALSRERLAQGESLRSICRDLGIQPKQIRFWMANEQKISQAKGRNKSVHRGAPSSIGAIADPLLDWFTIRRDFGHPVTVRSVVLKAEKLLPPEQFAEQRTWDAKYHCVRRLLRAHLITIRVGTHVSQELPQDALERAQNFLAEIRPIVATLPKHFVINMDQTPVYYSMHPARTLEFSGRRTVTIRTSSQRSTRATISVSVLASGGMLTPMLTFKGSKNGRIATRELPRNPEQDHMLLNCQSKAWVDKAIMLQWVDQVLKPYVFRISPPDIHPRLSPLLLLDSFSVHTCPEVKEAIQNLGVRLKHIPRGCTGLVQPVDVGIGKPLKDRIHNKWDDFIVVKVCDKS